LPRQVTIQIEATSRGFSRGEFVDRYGEKCSIQKSSLATEECIWLGVDHDPPTRMHLTQAHIKALLPLLELFARTGYLPSTGLFTGESEGDELDQ
jgi:hypothetical protein